MAEPSAPPHSPQLEIAHVLFTDIVGYSRLAIDQQERVLRTLQDLVAATSEFQRAQAEDHLVRLPTGDGMALVFFGNPEGPVHCAVELAKALLGHPEVALRMGIHSGPVYRVEDINANRNVAGGGINIAQRVMDCGDAGHILVSKTVADVLGQLSIWNGALKDLGEASVKHGVRVHIFSLQTQGVGNPKLPKKLQQAKVRKTTRWAGLALLAGIILGVPLAFRYFAGKGGGAAARSRRSVAVLGFRNLTGRPDNDWMSTALAEMLTTELAAGEQLRTVPGENVARMKNDLHLPVTDSLGETTLSAIRRALGTDLVVLGSYLDMDGQVRVDLRLQDAQAGETVASFSDTAPEAEIAELAGRLGKKLRGKCGAGELTSKQIAETQAARPASLDSARLYAEGLDKLHAYDALAARSLLEKAVEADPKNALVRSALAAAWAQLGYDARAQQEATTAFRLSKGLSREDGLVIEGFYRTSIADWERAVTVYATLSNFFPDNVDYGLALAEAQISWGKGAEAQRAVQNLRKLAEPLRSDPRIDLMEARAASSVSNYKQEQAAAARAVAKAQELGSGFLAAEGWLEQCWAFRNLGELESARTAGEKARGTFGEDKNSRGEARSLTCLANVLADQGDVAAARKLHEQALGLARKIGAQRDMAGALINIANLVAASDLASSTERYKEALEIAKAVGDKPDTLLAENGIGGNLMVRGEMTEARTALEDALKLARETGDQSVAAEIQNNLAAIALELGDLEAAQKNVDSALAISRWAGAKKDMASELIMGGEISLARDDKQGAGKMVEEAFDLSKQLGDKTGMASSRLAEAEVALEEGEAVRAQAAAQEAAAQFHASEDVDQEAAARELAARALLAENKATQAATEAEAGHALNARDQLVQLRLAVTAARAQASTGNAASAVKQLERILEQVRTKKLQKLEFDAMLAQAVALRSSGKADMARSALNSLAKQAMQAGFRLVARKASAAGGV